MVKFLTVAVEVIIFLSVVSIMASSIKTVFQSFPSYLSAMSTVLILLILVGFMTVWIKKTKITSSR